MWGRAVPRRLLHLRPWRRHSVVLAGAGFMYVVIGFAMATLPSNPQREQGLNLAVNIMPLQAWGFVWMGAGILALASTRWPPQSETWGYGVMAGLSALWGSLFLLGMPFRDQPSASVAGALVYYLLTFMWWAVAGLMNPGVAEPRRRAFGWDWSAYGPEPKPPEYREE